jgi:hypothetical protein
MNEIDAIRDASGVLTAKLDPYWICEGADVIVGLGPLNRYGGE